MSYILEALKKSENERQRGEVPDLQAHHMPYPGQGRVKKRRSGKFTKITLVCLLVGLSGTLFWFNRAQLFTLIAATRTNQPQTLSSGADEQPEKTATAESSASVIKTNVKSEAGEKSPTVTAAKNWPEQQKQIFIDPEAEQQFTAKESRPEEPTRIIRSVSGKVKASTTKPEPQAMQAPANTKENVAPPTPVILTPPSPGPVVLTEDFSRQPLDADIPFLEELPEAEKKNIPKLKLAGHTYATSSERRMIIINSKIIREGEIIESGLKLEKITWDGIVLSFKGKQFQIIVAQ